MDHLQERSDVLAPGLCARSVIPGATQAVATEEGMTGADHVVDGPLMRRVLLVLGPTEGLLSMGAFLTVLMLVGRTYGANAFACRSETRAVWTIDPLRNRLIVVDGAHKHWLHHRRTR